jgi:transposase
MNAKAMMYVGLDAGKTYLVCRDEKRGCRVRNEAKAVRQFLLQCQAQLTAPHLIIEPSGGTERIVLKEAEALGIPFTLANARLVRRYAEGLGWLEKSDQIDAQMLQLYGQTRQPAPTLRPNEQEQRLRELVQQRDRYVAQLRSEEVHLASLQWATQAARAQCTHLKKLIEKIEKQIEELIEKEVPELSDKVQTLCLVTGLSIRSAISLLAYVPELGRLTDREVSKLVGVAPIVDESGQRFGTRHIRHGRADARRVLYMNACVALQHNEHLKPFYQALIARGKAPKVAIIAVARKLLTFLNRLLKPAYLTPV